MFSPMENPRPLVPYQCPFTTGRYFPSKSAFLKVFQLTNLSQPPRNS